MNVLWVACGIWAVLAIGGLIWLAREIRSAREGYEDANGFHFGRRKQ